SAAKDATSIGSGTIMTDTVAGQTVYDGVTITLEGYTSENSGYYYAVFKSKSDSSNYAVLGGKQYAKGSESTTGVYDTDVSGPSGAPIGTDYVDIGPFLGGTWTAAKTPEPTVLALLSLGIAGVALRRKIV
ncbi:MAG: PEP-CTERM sorting domain-containing protein, partial [Candidatus Spyradenecus sp.]